MDAIQRFTGCRAHHEDAAGLGSGNGEDVYSRYVEHLEDVSNLGALCRLLVPSP